MTRHPVTDDSGKLSGFDDQATVLPRRKANHVLEEPHLRSAVAWIEATVEARLHEGGDIGANLRVEEESETGVYQELVVGEDETRRGLVDEVSLEIECAAEPNLNLIV